MICESKVITRKADKEINEDYCKMIQNKNVCIGILADGLGGLQAGEVASEFIVQEIAKQLDLANMPIDEKTLTKVINYAHKSLILEQKKQSNVRKMCSTVVVAIITLNCIIYAYVGDSRLYVFDNRKIIMQTKDHSVCQALVSMNEINAEDIRFHEDKNKVLSALGQEEGFKVSTGTINFSDKQQVSVLLCSDGVWENLNSIQLELEYCKSENVHQWLQNIEYLILKQGKKTMDNYSMVGVEINNTENLR